MEMRFLLLFGILSCAPSVLAAETPPKPPKKNATQLAAEKAAKEKEAAVKADLAAKKKAADEKAAKELVERENAAADPKNWKARDYRELKGLNQPLCILIKDDQKSSVFSGELEKALTNDKVKAKLKSLQRVKILSDSPEAKSLPADWLKLAEKGAALVLASSDLKFVLFIDPVSSNGKVTPQQVLEFAGKVSQNEMGRMNKADANEMAIPGLDGATAAKKPVAKKPVPADE